MTVVQTLCDCVYMEAATKGKSIRYIYVHKKLDKLLTFPYGIGDYYHGQ